MQLVGNHGGNPLDFAGFRAGNIALVERGGGVVLSTMVNNATSAGASGILIFNNIGGAPVGRLQDPTTLPALLITESLGQSFSTQLLAGAQIQVSMDVVPEPSTWLLLGTGVALLAGRRQRKKA